jgi:hypothetical protein
MMKNIIIISNQVAYIPDLEQHEVFWQDYVVIMFNYKFIILPFGEILVFTS